MSESPLAYRDFYYPLNVFMHVLSHEEGSVAYLHYGLFEPFEQSIASAQERSTAMLLERLPPRPASILEVGIGLATTLRRLALLGYEAHGITPDPQQIALARTRYGDELRVTCVPYESFEPRRQYDCVLFQESSQYIASDALFAKSAALTRHVIVLDEFAVEPVDTPGALHDLQSFLSAAHANGFIESEEIDLSEKAAPTVDYFLERLPRYRDALIADLGLDAGTLDELAASGRNYRDLYTRGIYTYRLLQFRRNA